MVKAKWLIILLLLVMIGSPQRILAQATRQKIFDVENSIYSFDWSPDSRWLVIIPSAGTTNDDVLYYDRETHTLHHEQPATLTHKLSAEERAYLHVATKGAVSISPNGRYVLYDSSDPVLIPGNLTDDEREEFAMSYKSQIYLADRQTRNYVAWTIANGLSRTWWSPDSSGVLVWLRGFETTALAGYVTGFQQDLAQLYVAFSPAFSAVGKDYFYFEDDDEIYALSIDGRKILLMAGGPNFIDERQLRSLVAFDVLDTWRSHVIERDVVRGDMFSDVSLHIGTAGFGTDIERYIWIVSDRGLLLHDLQNRTVRLVDSSINVDTNSCCAPHGGFSPDGKWLAYAVYNDENYQSTVYLVDLEQLWDR